MTATELVQAYYTAFNAGDMPAFLDLLAEDVVHDALDRAAVRCFCDVARVMGLKTVGEFVEDDPILQELLELGVDYAQGYLIHRPEPLGRLLGLTE